MAIRVAGALASHCESKAILARLKVQSESDDALMMAIQMHDQQQQAYKAGMAYDVLINRHRGLMWRVCKKTLLPQIDVDDAIQEITLTLWNQRQSWKPGIARFTTWLYRLAVNKCIDMNRASTPYHAELNDYMADDGCVNAEEGLQRKQMLIYMQDILSVLPLQQRLAMEMHYFNDLKAEEIAPRMNTTEVAVRSLLKRAKKALREGHSESIHYF